MATTPKSLAAHDKRFHGGHYEGGDCKYREERGIPTAPANGDSDSANAPSAAEQYLEAVEKDKKGKSGKGWSDKEYLAAIAKGDEDKVEALFRARADEAFSKSKVRDAEGNLAVVYRGTDYVPPNVLQWGYNDDNGLLIRNFVTTNKEVARHYGNNIQKFYLNIEKPNVLDCKGKRYSQLSYHGEDVSDAVVDFLLFEENGGFDGVQLKNIVETENHDDIGDDWIVNDGMADRGARFKLAEPITYDDNGKPIPLSRRFDFSNDDIRY